MISKLFIGLIRTYQLCISPLLGPSCRYYPTCSEYAVDAIKVHGIFKGSFLATRRVLRCHPGCEGGHDPVPEKRIQKTGIQTSPSKQPVDKKAKSL